MLPITKLDVTLIFERKLSLERSDGSHNCDLPWPQLPRLKGVTTRVRTSIWWANLNIALETKVSTGRFSVYYWIWSDCSRRQHTGIASSFDIFRSKTYYLEFLLSEFIAFRKYSNSVLFLYRGAYLYSSHVDHKIRSVINKKNFYVFHFPRSCSIYNFIIIE